jgi:3-oxoacyl-[acyl-carrier protein] reductase
VDLRDRIAIITGVDNEIGVATARRFLAEGAKALLVGADVRLLEELKLEAAEPSSVMATEEVGEAAIETTVNMTVAAHGQIDILVNAAGLEDGCAWENTDSAEWERQVAGGPTLVFAWCRAVSPHMAKRKRGKIVNIGWNAGRYRSAYFRTSSSFRAGVAYAAGQGSVLAMTRELAFEVAPDGIHVNAVVPGLIETSRARQEWERLSESERSYILAESALGRLGTPDEVAAVICFLASERSSYMTGTSIDVNGGWWMS